MTLSHVGMRLCAVLPSSCRYVRMFVCLCVFHGVWKLEMFRTFWMSLSIFSWKCDTKKKIRFWGDRRILGKLWTSYAVDLRKVYSNVKLREISTRHNRLYGKLREHPRQNICKGLHYAIVFSHLLIIWLFFSVDKNKLGEFDVKSLQNLSGWTIQYSVFCWYSVYKTNNKTNVESTRISATAEEPRDALY